MINNGKKRHYLAVKNLSRLLREITSNHNEGFYCLNCFHSHSTETRLKKYERECNDHDYCHVKLPNEDDKTLKYNYGENSLKSLFFIPFDVEVLLPKRLPLKIIPKNLTQRERLSIYFQVTRVIISAHLMQQKTNVILAEGRTVLKGFVNCLKIMHWK